MAYAFHAFSIMDVAAKHGPHLALIEVASTGCSDALERSLGQLFWMKCSHCEMDSGLAVFRFACKSFESLAVCGVSKMRNTDWGTTAATRHVCKCSKMYHHEHAA